MNHAALWTRRSLTTGLTGIAFWNSYSHTAQWFRDNGQKDQAGWLALIPEAGVILAVLTLATETMNRPLKWVIGAFGIGSLSLTLISNVSAAGPGFMGLLAALVAPVFAVLGFALEVLSLQSEPEVVQAEPVHDISPAGAEPVHAEPVIVVQTAQPEPVHVEPKSVQKVAQRRPVSRSNGGLLDNGILWATEKMGQSGSWPTRKEIVDQFPEMSLATAKRVRAANPVGTDGTAKLKESVNA